MKDNLDALKIEDLDYEVPRLVKAPSLNYRNQIKKISDLREMNCLWSNDWKN